MKIMKRMAYIYILTLGGRSETQEMTTTSKFNAQIQTQPL